MRDAKHYLPASVGGEGSEWIIVEEASSSGSGGSHSASSTEQPIPQQIEMLPTGVSGQQPKKKRRTLAFITDADITESRRRKKH